MEIKCGAKMFEEYLEKELQRHLKIITLLWDSEFLTSLEIADILSVTAATIKSDIKSINKEYGEKTDPLIVSSSMGYSIFNKVNKEKKYYFKKVYRSSLFIKATCFFLKHDFSKIDQLEEIEYISQAKAYNIKKRVNSYLERLGIVKNEVTVEYAELRIRFLMAFFQWEIGIDVVDIPSENRIIFNILFNEVAALEKCMFSERSKEYAMILFQLDFVRRKNNKVSFHEEEVEFIKETIIYKRLGATLNFFLEKMLRFDIKEEEAIYFALIFNIMNANYYEDYSETYYSYVNLIKSSSFLKYNLLIQGFETQFNIKLSKNSIFESALIGFLRKCILNLQPFIPEEHVSLGHIVKIPNDIIDKTKKVLQDWNMQTNLDLSFSNAHVIQLTAKLFFALREKERPRKLYLLTSFHSDYLLAKEIVTKEYGALVQIRRFNPGIQAEYHQDDIILYDMEYEILNKFSSKKLKINYIFDLNELQNIRALLFGYDLEGLEKQRRGNVKSI